MAYIIERLTSAGNFSSMQPVARIAVTTTIRAARSVARAAASRHVGDWIQINRVGEPSPLATYVMESHRVSRV